MYVRMVTPTNIYLEDETFVLNFINSLRKMFTSCRYTVKNVCGICVHRVSALEQIKLVLRKDIPMPMLNKINNEDIKI